MVALNFSRTGKAPIDVHEDFIHLLIPESGISIDETHFIFRIPEKISGDALEQLLQQVRATAKKKGYTEL